MLLNANFSDDFDGFDQYLRSVALNFGLSSLLTIRSPKEMIDGYIDPHLEKLSQTSILKGGD